MNHLFYHVAMMNNYEEVFQEQIQTLQKSQILSNIIFHINFVGPQKNKKRLLKYIKELDSKYNIKIYTYEKLEDYEFSTLNLLKRSTFQGTRNIVGYIHTKGVSKPDDTGRIEWRKRMMKDCILKWRECFELLNYHDICGRNWKTNLIKRFTSNSYGRYAGNFWWATESYIRTLPNPLKFKKERFLAEIWIGMSSRAPKLFDWRKGHSIFPTEYACDY